MHSPVDLLGNRVCPVLPDHVIDSLPYLFYSSLLHQIVSLLDHPVYGQEPLPSRQQNQRELSAEPYINLLLGANQPDTANETYVILS